MNTALGNPRFELRFTQTDLAPTHKMTYFEGNNILFGRFLPYNIMHVIHDDLLGAYFSLVESFPSQNEIDPYDLETRFFFFFFFFFFF